MRSRSPSGLLSALFAPFAPFVPFVPFVPLVPFVPYFYRVPVVLTCEAQRIWRQRVPPPSDTPPNPPCPGMRSSHNPHNLFWGCPHTCDSTWSWWHPIPSSTPPSHPLQPPKHQRRFRGTLVKSWRERASLFGAIGGWGRRNAGGCWEGNGCQLQRTALRYSPHWGTIHKRQTLSTKVPSSKFSEVMHTFFEFLIFINLFVLILF